MDVVAGKDAAAQSGGMERLLEGIRRLTALADSATDSEAVFAGLARELLAAPGAEEIHIHHLARGQRRGPRGPLRRVTAAAA